MRYQLWHLMLLVLIVALALKGADVYTHRTVTVRFSDPSLPPMLPLLPPATPVEGLAGRPEVAAFPVPEVYILDFEVGDEGQRTSRCVMGKFGPNTLFGRDITPENLDSLDGVTVEIRHRHRSLPWLPATRIEDEVARHFQELLPIWETDLLPPTAWMAGS
jgi:hypothetical protein